MQKYPFHVFDAIRFVVFLEQNTENGQQLSRTAQHRSDYNHFRSIIARGTRAMRSVINVHQVVDEIVIPQIRVRERVIGQIDVGQIVDRVLGLDIIGIRQDQRIRLETVIDRIVCRYFIIVV